MGTEKDEDIRKPISETRNIPESIYILTAYQDRNNTIAKECIYSKRMNIDFIIYILWG